MLICIGRTRRQISEGYRFARPFLPEDLSVTGFDNAALAARNGITTVSQDFGEMAKMALNMIFYQLANPALINNCSGVSHIRSVLWERWSTAPAKESEAH